MRVIGDAEVQSATIDKFSGIMREPSRFDFERKRARRCNIVMKNFAAGQMQKPATNKTPIGRRDADLAMEEHRP
jgi:hypothetical protein